MSLLANYADFEAGGLYDPAYRRFPYFGERAKELVNVFGFNKRFLVLGAGFGYLLDELRLLGAYSEGVELSEYALRRCFATVPQMYNFMHWVDATDTSAIIKLGRFDVVVTEDLLPVCNRFEIKQVLQSCRAVGSEAFHIVSTRPQFSTDEEVASKCDARLLWLSLEEWVKICGSDMVVSADG